MELQQAVIKEFTDLIIKHTLDDIIPSNSAGETKVLNYNLMG